jgi:hypothetical protein
VTRNDDDDDDDDNNNNNNNNLKPEWCGSPLAQEEKYQGRKKTCDKR